MAGSWQCPVEVSCEHGNKTSSAKKVRESRDEISYSEIMKESSHCVLFFVAHYQFVVVVNSAYRRAFHAVSSSNSYVFMISGNVARE